MVKFSFIVPVYNGEKYLERCISSILRQDFENFEIVIINDGSTDDSLLIIEKMAKEHMGKIRFYTTINSGLSASRNYGFNVSNGEYIIYIDVDDYYNVKFLSSINDIVTRHIVDIITINTNILCKDSNVAQKAIAMHDGIYICEDLIKATRYQVMPMAWLYVVKKTSVLREKITFLDGYFHEDCIYTFELFTKMKSIYVTDIVCHVYDRTNENSITRVPNQKKYYDKIKISKFIKHIIVDSKYRNINNENKKFLLNYSSYLSFSAINDCIDQGSKISSLFQYSSDCRDAYLSNVYWNSKYILQYIIIRMRLYNFYEFIYKRVKKDN